MKRRIFAIVTALVLSLSLCVTAHAAETAGGVYDHAGLMNPTQQQELLTYAQEVSAQYGVGVYGFILNDYREYTDGEMEDLADILYNEAMPEEDAILLILSMADRDYLLISYGEFGHYAFNDEGRLYLTDYFLDDFGENDWYSGFYDYIEMSASFMDAANAGEPYSGSNVPLSSEEKMTSVLIALGVALAIAGIRVALMSHKMYSVASARTASGYLKGGINLTRRSDVFTHKTVTRQKIEKASTTTRSGGGGGHTVRSSGGGHGTRGKF